MVMSTEMAAKVKRTRASESAQTLQQQTSIFIKPPKKENTKSIRNNCNIITLRNNNIKSNSFTHSSSTTSTALVTIAESPYSTS